MNTLQIKGVIFSKKNSAFFLKVTKDGEESKIEGEV